jgi:hypothetical protein
MDSPIPLVYILSSGRSGSTLTDLVLGSHRDIWTLGEAQLLPYELSEEGAPCGCGVPITECDFWSAVLPKIPLGEGEYPIGFLRESHTRRKTLHWRKAATILAGGVSTQQARAARSYGRLNAQYFSAVQREAIDRGHSVKWLVDASKGPYRLYWLLYSACFNTRVIHLTKDPRAYVYSIARKQESYSIRDVMRWASRWMIDNIIQLIIKKRHLRDEAVIHIKYEDLATNPKKVLKECVKWLKLSDKKVEKKRSIRTYKNHAISGNEMRWEETSIRLDEKWKTELKSKEKKVVWVVSGWLAKLFGYDMNH